MHAVQFGRGCARERRDAGEVAEAAAAEADTAQHLAGDAHVVDLERQGRRAGIGDDAVRAGEPAGGHAARRAGPGEQGARELREGRRTGHIGEAEPERAARVGRDRRGRADDRRARGRHEVASRGQVHAHHRQAVEGRLEHRLLVDAAERCGVRQVALLGGHERAADADGARPEAERLRELAVEPLAVLQEVRVAVLVARARDQRGPLLRECLDPVKGLGRVGHGVAVDDRVARMAAGAEDHGVREVHARGSELGSVHRRRVVRRKQVVGAEVPGQVHEVVPAAEQARAQPVGCPRRQRRRSGDRRVDILIRDQGVGAGPTEPGAEGALHTGRAVAEEVVAGDERGGRLEHAVDQERVDHARDLGRRLDEAPDRQIGHGQRHALGLDLGLRAVGILRQEVVEAQGRLGGGRAQHRRHVARLGAEAGRVRIAEERHGVIRADDDHGRERRVGDAVGEHDIADGIGDEVLRVRAAGVAVGLQVEGRDARAHSAQVENPPADRGFEAGQPGLHRRQAPAHARVVGEDQRLKARLRGRAQQRRRAGRDARARAGINLHVDVEWGGRAEGPVAAGDAHVELARVVPGVRRDVLIGIAVIRGHRDQAAHLRALVCLAAAEHGWAEHRWREHGRAEHRG